MFYLLFPLLFPDSSPMNSEIIMERPINKVEWGDMMLEYEPSQAPQREQEVNVSLVIHHASLNNNLLHLTMDMQQTWMDPRLRFQGNSKVSLPSNIHIWTPDTYVVNSIRDDSLRKARFLRFDGTIYVREKRSVEVPCNQPSNCSLVLGSFVNYGTSVTVYHLHNVTWDDGCPIQNVTVRDDVTTKWDAEEYRNLVIELDMQKDS